MSFRPIERRNEVMAGISKSFLTKPRRWTLCGLIAILKIIYTKSCYFLDKELYGISLIMRYTKLSLIIYLIDLIIERHLCS